VPPYALNKKYLRFKIIESNTERSIYRNLINIRNLIIIRKDRRIGTIFVNSPLGQSSLEIISIYHIHTGEVIYRR
jgi:hypothetical protein